FVFGFSKLDVLFGRVAAEHVGHRYTDLVERPGARFVQAQVTAIDPGAKRVETDAGDFDADVLVIALGADLDAAATPGLVEGGHEFYTVAGAFAARDVLAGFGGGRVVVAVTSTPFKCPPAPSETALLMHDFLVARGLRDTSSISLVMPLPRPIPPSPAASEALLAAFAERGIAWLPDRVVTGLDPGRNVALLADGTELDYDLFLGVPKHRAPEVVVAAGMTADGWIPVDPHTLETAFPGVYAIGDVTSVGTPKAGVFAEGQAAVVADRIGATIAGSGSTEYDGRGICYIEFGGETVGRVEVTFRPGAAPVGNFDEPSTAWTADKSEFGRSRVARWFGRDWLPLG
ncbi:MAG: sulfide:quinone oxidoreductase, partial [Pseudonocardiales bacterium]|nr:sulfide:quinone oxidoreductase [Pseudonocardiales bacterium]